MSESESLTQVMSSSHSSSEGSSIGGFVVVDKCSEHFQNSGSCEDGKSSDISAKTENLAQAGSTAESQAELMERVQNLSKENEELKGVLHKNNKLLEEYFEDLANIQKNQKQTNESLRKGYDNAKEAVKKLREKNCTLKTELKNEQNKSLQLEEQLSKLKDAKLNEPSPCHDNVAQEDQGKPVQVKSLEEVVKRLESEKDTLELNNSKLQEHISCLKAMREAEQHTENDDCETLISLESLTSDTQTSPEELQSENYKKLETEKEILKVDLDRLKIENEQKQQQCNKLEDERDTLLKELADIKQRQTIELEEIKPETTDTQASMAASEQVTALCQQLQLQTEALSNLKEDLYAVRQENEMLKKTAEDLEKEKETTKNNQDTETMKQQLQAYQEKERENQEGADKQAARQTELMKEIAELKQQLETERMVVGKLREDVNNMTHERDVCKRKVEEMEMQSEESKGTGDESFGESGDTLHKDELMAKLKKQIWDHQDREGKLLNRENAVLEKENQNEQLLEEKKTLELQLAEVLKEKDKHLEEGRKQEEQLLEEKKTLELQLAEVLKEKDKHLEEGRKQEEQVQSLQRQLSSMSDELNETHGHEVNQLKEELQLKDAAMAKVTSNVEQLKVNATKLMETKVNLLTECQKLTEDCSHKEEELESLKKQLSDLSSELNETREREVNQLEEELTRKGEALSTAETTMESLKAQVTQLIQENQSLTAERERIMDDYTQQENMYQDHLLKITEDSESQRSKRDEIIKTLRKQVTAMDIELQRTRAELEAERTVVRQLQEEHERAATEFKQLLEDYHISMDKNKELEGHLEYSENHRKKLKEDLGLKDEELRNLRQKLFDSERQQKEELRIRDAQMEIYRSDFQVERDAREKQHEQILRLQADNQRYQEEIDQLGNRGIAEMQRRHASFVPEPRDIQQQQQQQEQPRGWFDGFLPMFARGPGDPSAFPNPAGTTGNYDRAPMGGDHREQFHHVDEEDWVCPTCRRVLPDFDTLQIHAVECNGVQAHPAAADVDNQCPSCLGTFPDYDSLAIHVEECLDQHQGN